MKKLGKVTALVLVLSIALSMFSTLVFAADANPYENEKVEIVISQTTIGKLSKQDYINSTKAFFLKKGYKEENIIFHDAMTTVNTSSLDGWYVYDHYNNPSWTPNTKPTNWNDYGGKKPFFYDAESYSGGTYYSTISDAALQQCYDRPQHIWSLNDGKDILFVGYDVEPYTDFALYPSLNKDPKIIEFDIEATKIDTHTLVGAGFLFNAGIDANGIISGYELFYQFDTPTTGTVYLGKIADGISAAEMHTSGTGYSGTGALDTIVASEPFELNEKTKKAHLKIDVSATTVTCELSDYTSATALGTAKKLFGGEKVIDNTNVSNFGPVVSYSSHSCSSLSMFTFSKLNMAVNSSVGSAIKEVIWDDDDSKKIIIDITDETPPEEEKEKIIEGLVSTPAFYIGIGGGGGGFITTGLPNPSIRFNVPITIKELDEIFDDPYFDDITDPTKEYSQLNIKGTGDSKTFSTPTAGADIKVYDSKDLTKVVATLKTGKVANKDGEYEVTVDVAQKLTAAGSTNKTVLVEATEVGKYSTRKITSVDPQAAPYAQAGIKDAKIDPATGTTTLTFDFPSITVLDKSYTRTGNDKEVTIEIYLPDGTKVTGDTYAFNSASPVGEYRVVLTVKDKGNKLTDTVTKIVNVKYGVPTSTEMDGAVDNLVDPDAKKEEIEKDKDDIIYAYNRYQSMTDEEKGKMDSTKQNKLIRLVESLVLGDKTVVLNDTTNLLHTVVTNLMALINQQDIKDILGGMDIAYKINVTNGANNLDYNDIRALQNAGFDAYKNPNSIFFISIEKYINNVLQSNKLTELNGKIRITIDIPEELRGFSEYKVSNIHTVVDRYGYVLSTDVVELADLDEDPNTVTFETEKLSPFVLTHNEVKQEPVNVPTSDAMNVAVMAFLMITTLSLAGVMVFKLKKSAK